MSEIKYYGYIRVSTEKQNNIRQKNELLKFGVKEEDIFSDAVSGKDFKRKGYQKLRRTLKENDVLVVKSLDRLGRNYEDIKNEWLYITKTKKADIVIIDMPLLDTRTDKDLLGKVISDIVLELLSYVAQTERDFIKQRQAEGIAAAKASGTKFGRPQKPYPKGFTQVYKQIKDKEITQMEGAKLLGIEVYTMRRLITKRTNELEKKNLN